MSNVEDPVTKTTIASAWGKTVADDLDALFATKIDQPTADARYVNITGDMMTGALTIDTTTQMTGDIAIDVLADSTPGKHVFQLYGASGSLMVGYSDDATPGEFFKYGNMYIENGWLEVGQKVAGFAGTTYFRAFCEATFHNKVTLNADPAQPLEAATKQYVDAKSGAPIRYTINAQVGTAYTIALSDENKLVTLNNAGAITLTVPTNAVVAFPVGARVDAAQIGAGQVTVAGAGITFKASPTLKLRAEGSAVSLIKLATDTWIVSGDLASS